jgi:hypothetical protein
MPATAVNRSSRQLFLIGLSIAISGAILFSAKALWQS